MYEALMHRDVKFALSFTSLSILMGYVCVYVYVSMCMSKYVSVLVGYLLL
jgi:hypothetical protein